MAFFANNSKKDNQSISPAEAECVKKIDELTHSRMELIMQIGKTFLENNTPEQLAGTPYLEPVSQIIALDKELDYQEKRKLAVKGLRKCEKCGNILVLDSAFCNKCGEKLAPLFTAETTVQPVCPVCGSPYKEDAVFCTSCGNKLK